MGILKVIGALVIGTATGVGAAYVDNKVRKAWTVPARFPEKLPVLGGKSVPLGGKEFESGWALVGIGVVAAFFGAPLWVTAPIVAGAAGIEGPKVVSQFAPYALLPHKDAAAVAGMTGGIHVGALGGSKRRLTDEAMKARLETLAKRATAPAAPVRA